MASLLLPDQSHTSLNSFEDTMEISSDTGHQGDDDIDIDIDVPTEESRFTNDDDMADDNATVTQDDVMFDEDRPGDVTEERMLNYPQDFPDEELADINDEYGTEFEAPSIQETLEDQTLQPVANDFPVLAEYDNAESDILGDNTHISQSSELQGAEEHIQKGSEEDALEDEIHYDDVATEQQLDNGGSFLNEAHAGGYNPSLGDSSAIEEHSLATDNHISKHVESHEVSDGKVVFVPETTTLVETDSKLGWADKDENQETSNASIFPQEPISLSANIEIRGDQEGEHSSEGDQESLLHPVIVHWEEEEIPLFASASDEVSEYFLDDASLSSSPLIDLFAAFKEVLRDESSDPFALSIEFMDMGMYVDEHEAKGLDITLTNLINLYHHLKLNDAIDDPGPLHLRLTMRETAASRFTFLLNNATEGIGMSQVTLVYPLSDVVGAEDVISEHAAEDQLEEGDQHLEVKPPITHAKSSDLETLGAQLLLRSVGPEEINNVSSETTFQGYNISGDVRSTQEPGQLNSRPVEDDLLGVNNEVFDEDDLLDDNGSDNYYIEENVSDKQHASLTDADKGELRTDGKTSYHSLGSLTTQKDAMLSNEVKPQITNEVYKRRAGTEEPCEAPSSPAHKSHETVSQDQNVEWEEQEEQKSPSAVQTSTLNDHLSDEKTSDAGSPLQDFENSVTEEQTESTYAEPLPVDASTTASSHSATRSEAADYRKYDRNVTYSPDVSHPKLSAIDAANVFDSGFMNIPEERPQESINEFFQLDAEEEPVVDGSPSGDFDHGRSKDENVQTPAAHKIEALDPTNITRKRPLGEVVSATDQPEAANDVKRSRAH